MVKLHCDRCGKEIVGKHYYTITVGEAELNPKPKYEYDISDCANAISSYSRELEKSPYEKLSSQVMYCKNCADDIIYTINHYTEEL